MKKIEGTLVRNLFLICIKIILVLFTKMTLRVWNNVWVSNDIFG